MKESTSNKSTSLVIEVKKGEKRKVDIKSIEIDGIDRKDYPDFTDAYITAAMYEDGKPLNDEELDLLSETHPEIVNQLIFENQLY